MFLNNFLDSLLNLFFFSNITRAPINFLISRLLSQTFDSFINIVNLATDDVDRCSVLQEIFGDAVANAGGSTADENQLTLVELRTEDGGHLLTNNIYLL